MKKTALLLVLSMPLSGSQFLFGLVPFRAELSDWSRKAVACLNSVCAVQTPVDLHDAVAEAPASPRPTVAAVGFVPGRGFIVLPSR